MIGLANHALAPELQGDKANERLKTYRQINNLLAKDLPYLLLNYFDNYSLVSKKVHGIPLVPDGLLRLQTVWKDK